MAEIRFKERVINVAICEAKNYKRNFVEYEYLVCSDAFKQNDYYIIDAQEDNYQHLIGINSLISPQLFFDKCYNETLQETDFNFIKKGQPEKAVIGSVRRKITVLPDVMNLFQNSNILVEENYAKNSVICSFATSDGKCTLGFINSLKSYPKSLIKGNGLDNSKTNNISLLLRKKTGIEKFNELIIGNNVTISKYFDKIKNEIDKSFEEVAASISL